MNLFVISIRAERLSACQKRLGNRITKVFGVNGQTLDKNRLISSGVYKPSSKWHSMTRGELGCFLSHRAVWEHIIEEKITNPSIIIEDDCILDEIKFQEAEQKINILQTLTPHWNVLLFSRMPEVCKNTRVFQNIEFCIPGRSWGLSCYAVTPKGCSILSSSSYPISEAVDTYVSGLLFPGKFALLKNLCETPRENSDTFDIK